MAAALDLNGALFVDLRLHVVASGSHDRQRYEHIHCRNGTGCLLDPHNLCRNGIPHPAEQVVLQRKELVLCSQDHILQVLELIRSVALCIGQGLFADKIFRNQIFKGIRNLKVVTEHLVVFDLQVLNTGAFTLPCFQLSQPCLALGLCMAQAVRLLVVAIPYHAALTDRDRRFLNDRTGDQVLQIFQRIQLLFQFF